MDNPDSINDINEAIKKLREERESLVAKANRRGTSGNSDNAIRIEEIDERVNELIRKRNQKLRKAYTRPVIQPPPSAKAGSRSKVDTRLRSKVTKMNIKPDKTTLKMTPSWFEPDDQQEALKDIVYPPDTVEHRPFDTIARFRTATGQSNNFCRQPLSLGENSTEMLILMLDAFAQQFDADLSFTNHDLPFDECAHRTACGVGNLGSTHLLATNYVPTARFAVIVDIDYDKNLASSEHAMTEFVLNFSQAIAQFLNIPEDYVRVISVEKSIDQPHTTVVHFGLTGLNRQQAERVAQAFQIQARTGFGDNPVLHYIKPANYEYTWASMLSYLQLRPYDFAPEYNMDYRRPDLQEVDQRGGYPYYLPLGWYRHALKVDEKYPDDGDWLGSINVEGEWPVAFHGTHANAIAGVTQGGLLISTLETDPGRDEAVQQMGSTMAQPGIYLTTHCNGGAHPNYTRPFYLDMTDKKKSFRVVFMCRVQPDKFTTHQISVSKGHNWRVVDPDAIRPYGILIKDEDTPTQS